MLTYRPAQTSLILTLQDDPDGFFFGKDIDIIRDFSRSHQPANYQSAIDWDRYVAMIFCPPKALKAALPNAVVKVPSFGVLESRGHQMSPQMVVNGKGMTPPKQAIHSCLGIYNLPFPIQNKSSIRSGFAVAKDYCKYISNRTYIIFYSWWFYFQHIAKILVVDDSISKGTYLSMKWPLDWVYRWIEWVVEHQ